ncbi:MAG: nucleotidyltransferase domain-containing protein, partial [Candidatus Tectomicrobia bacterium]|nr:nucleotidyltransferase domain-containing protein [Candidatus Tectomicrobia bacterium]
MLFKAFLEKVSLTCQEHPVRFAVVYGSRAKERSRERSDYDVAIWIDSGDLWEVADAVYCHLMDQLFGTGTEVDLVVLNHASSLLWREVARDGKVAFEAELHAFWRFQLRAMKAWEDWKKFHNLNSRYS